MPAAETPPQSAPRTWCLLGRKAGDNAQVTALADALGWPWEPRHIAARAWELLPHLSLRVTLAGIDREGDHLAYFEPAPGEGVV